ncbi:hypothetical protein [Syntrophorhabdus aromaticivorans]|uniref:hypothetical protein n=1 Tax=Syntrophorhabdus aromaticivorans TaxID=328301 RepID=UPI00040B711D|nr:hypothetical protein [Syntrophorhabdus aromaticivorans]
MILFEAWSKAKIGQKVRRCRYRDDPERNYRKGDLGICIDPQELLFNDWEIADEEEPAVTEREDKA